jgi:DNA-binding MarR family transcriptional regulator
MRKTLSKYPPIQRVVLRFLAQGGPKSSYDIASELGLHRSSTSKALRSLKKEGRVLVVERRRARSGARVEVYDISAHSLIEVLRSCRSMETAKYIINNHAGKLPLVLGKWDFFEEMGVEDIAFKLLRGFSYAGWAGEPFKNKPGTRKYEEEYSEYFQWSFYLSAYDMLSEEEFDRWMAAISKDDEISGFILSQIGKEKERLLEKARELGELERKIASALQRP